MTGDLEKIDILRARFGVGYKEARDALEAAGGDVIQALVNFEEKGRNIGERLQAHGQEVADKLKKLLHNGQNYRIKLKKGGNTVFEVPATVGALGLVGTLISKEFAILGALGTVTAMVHDYTLEFERRKM